MVLPELYDNFNIKSDVSMFKGFDKSTYRYKSNIKEDDSYQIDIDKGNGLKLDANVSDGTEDDTNDTNDTDDTDDTNDNSGDSGDGGDGGDGLELHGPDFEFNPDINILPDFDVTLPTPDVDFDTPVLDIPDWEPPDINPELHGPDWENPDIEFDLPVMPDIPEVPDILPDVPLKIDGIDLQMPEGWEMPEGLDINIQEMLPDLNLDDIKDDSVIRQGDGTGYGEIVIGDNIVLDVSKHLDRLYGDMAEDTMFQEFVGSDIYNAIKDPTAFTAGYISNEISDNFELNDVGNKILTNSIAKLLQGNLTPQDVADTAAETVVYSIPVVGQMYGLYKFATGFLSWFDENDTRDVANNLKPGIENLKEVDKLFHSFTLNEDEFNTKYGNDSYTKYSKMGDVAKSNLSDYAKSVNEYGREKYEQESAGWEEIEQNALAYLRGYGGHPGALQAYRKLASNTELIAVIEKEKALKKSLISPTGLVMNNVEDFSEFSEYTKARSAVIKNANDIINNSLDVYEETLMQIENKIKKR